MSCPTRFSLAGAPSRYATIARTMQLAASSDADDAAGEKLLTGLEALNRRLKIPTLRECPRVNAEIFEASLNKMAADALASGSPQNNPVQPTAEEIVALYREAW